MPFSSAVKEKALVRSRRCCCVCHEFAGRNSNVHHIIQEADGGSNILDNAVVLCLRCHGEAGHYNPKHPIGNKYSPTELCRHRDLWWEWCEKYPAAPIPTFPPEALDQQYYIPFPSPDPDDFPGPGSLPPGSRVPLTRNNLFTGRTDTLKSLARTLLHNEPSSTLVTQTIGGMGGVGKTQLAVEFAYRYGRFFHGVHWINAAQPETIDADVAACGREMCLPHWPVEQPDQVALTLNVWRHSEPRLVVLDNLEDVDAAREWLAPLSGGGARVLVTARRSDWPADLGLKRLPVETFTLEESRAFLRCHLPKERASVADLDRLAERLGHLPLALELAGRYIAGHARLSVADYLEKLETVWDHPSMAGWREELGNPTGHDLDLAATFALSWEQVIDRNARCLFLLAGWCAPNRPIPCALLERAAKLEAVTCDEALTTLAGLGLLEMQNTQAGPFVHPLLAEYARHQKEALDLIPVLAGVLVRLAREANRRIDDTGSASHFVPLLPHMRFVARAAERKGLSDAASLWGNLGYYLHKIADYADAQEACERALTIDEKTHEPDHPIIAVRVNNLAGVLLDLGDLGGARVALERALAIEEQVCGSNHPNVARAINNLGGVLQDLGELGGAREAFERALRMFEHTLGSDHPNVATSLDNLGSVLRDMGDLPAARVAFERALTINERVYGPEHPSVARSVGNSAGVLKRLGNLPGALAAYERALAINQQVLGSDHPDVAMLVNNLGSVRQDMGDYVGARDAFEQALEITERCVGSDHPSVALHLNNLGGVLHDQGNLADARRFLERALAIDERTFGSQHPTVARDLNALGMVLCDLGDLTGAREALEQAIMIDEDVYGPNHPNVARDVNNVGYVLQAQGDLAGAREAYERAMGIDEQFLGPIHPNVAIAANNLGSVLVALGDLQGAQEIYERALRILEDHLPAGHPHIESVRENLEGLGRNR